MPPAPIRREGFAGQHLVVLPNPVRRQALRDPLLRSLHVTDAGYFPAAEGHRVERPHGAGTHLLIVCLHGAGWVSSPKGRQDVGPGDLVWISADAPHAYGAADEQPWTIVWAHFRGYEVPHWQREIGWPKPGAISYFPAGIDGATRLAFDKIYARLESGYSTPHQLSAAAALRTVFCAAIELTQGAGVNRTTAMRIAAVRDQIVAEPARPYRLEELATSAGLSVPHFCLLFRRLSGYAPIDFLLRERIRRAARLLDTTPAKIAAVASEVGFADPYYFSRRFRLIMGLSPRAYRQIVKG